MHIRKTTNTVTRVRSDIKKKSTQRHAYIHLHVMAVVITNDCRAKGLCALSSPTLLSTLSFLSPFCQNTKGF